MPELDMDWIHLRVGLDWIELVGVTVTPFFFQLVIIAAQLMLLLSNYYEVYSP